MKVLFFTPTLARTGSEIAIYNLICNTNRQEIKMAVAVGAEGDLLCRLPSDVPHSNYNVIRIPSTSERLRGKVLRKFSKGPNEDAWLAEFTQKYPGYIWYLNTICQPRVLKQARKFGISCVVHSHEMEQMLSSLAEEEIADIVEYPQLVIACSKAAESVMRQLGRKDNLEVVYEPIDIGKIVSSAERAEEVRRKLNIDKDKFVWAMSGTLDPNKNPPLFMALASEMLERKVKAHFMWIGGGGGRGYRLFIEGASRSRVIENISWVGARTGDYYDYLNAADGFVLTSFRDSFPLTMIEAAALGKPIVSFDSGGVREFVQPGMGVVINSWNRPDLTQAMIQVMTGEIACDPGASRAQAAKFDAPLQAGRWQDVMRSYFNSSVRSS
jgi:glycosyltransferase involved in cell wall biosynthesis